LSGDDTKTTDSYHSPLDELDSFADDEAQDSTIVDSDYDYSDEPDMSVDTILDGEVDPNLVDRFHQTDKTSHSSNESTLGHSKFPTVVDSEEDSDDQETIEQRAIRIPPETMSSTAKSDASVSTEFTSDGEATRVEGEVKGQGETKRIRASGIMRSSNDAGDVRQVEIRPDFIEQIEGLEMFGDFVLLKPMGLGGMSEIRLAFRLENRKFEEVCVVKRLLNYAGENNQSMEMFRDEARIGRLIQHPNVVHQLEAGRVGKVPYIALELVDGINLITLSRLMDDDLIPLNIVMEVGISVARALHQAHTLRGDRGQPLDFVHRDITPHNILISRDGVVKLSDFGIAKYRGATSQTEVGITKGKRGYSAPEYLQGEKATAAADIFSLAVVLAELCVGKQLFEESCIDVPDLEFHLRASLDTRQRPIPAGLRELLVKMTSKSPLDRPSSALEIIESLESLLEATDKSTTLKDLAAEKVKLRSPPIEDVIDEFLKWTQDQQSRISNLHQSTGQDPFYPRDDTPQHIANLFSSSSEELLYVSNFFPTTSDFAVLGREYFDQSDAEQQAFVREAAEYSESFPSSSIPKFYATPHDDMVSDTYLRPPDYLSPDDAEGSVVQDSTSDQRSEKGKGELESKPTSRGKIQPQEVPAWFVVISVVFTFAVGLTAYIVIRHFLMK